MSGDSGELVAGIQGAANKNDLDSCKPIAGQYQSLMVLQNGHSRGSGGEYLDPSRRAKTC